MPYYSVVVTADPAKLTPNDNKQYVDWIRRLTGLGLMDAYTCFKEMRAGKPMVVDRIYLMSDLCMVPDGLNVETSEHLNEWELETKKRKKEWDAAQVLLNAGAAGDANAAIELCKLLVGKPWSFQLSSPAYAG